MPNPNKPFRRTGSNSWEELLDKVNDKLQNPPEDTDCEAIDEIDIPDAPHRWAKSDIREVHDALNEMPGDCFNFQEIPDLWRNSTIKDIEDQLDNSWCDCESECTQEDQDAQRALDGTITVLGTLPPVLWTNCEAFKDPGSNILWTEDGSITDQGHFFDFCDTINGSQVGDPGFAGRFVRLGSRNVGDTGIGTIIFAAVNCEGIVEIPSCAGPHSVAIPFQRFGNCPNLSFLACGTPGCDTIFNDALILFASDPTREVVMQLSFSAAVCEEC